ncbi:transporter substrate-binding domain-containing protein [Marinobacterium arenosum]|uniref:transporter substrate-binding domain-containing protein n=1 Tax=Marinobacterium arenosum TaxID=2862496 RepID=UPI001C94CBEA|nr:transporter substrate-binding domain-containing protein [Marinobacterium arenosum]MBY4675715.1 transporter substrate-binding domain-containing protein [Marinobacterium arenosum]
MNNPADRPLHCRELPKLLWVILPTLLCALLLSGGIAQARTFQPDDIIVVGGDYNYPPYEFLDEDGQPAGYNVELTRAIAEVMGMKVRFELADWAEMREALENGDIDALQGMVSSTERSATLAFSPPHAIVYQSIFARRGDPKATSLEQLRGKQVVVQQHGIMHDYLLQNDVGAIIITAATHADALRQLAAGKYDYALVANLPGLYLGQELGLSNIVPVGRPFQAQRYGYAVLKGHEELLAQFSEGLAILKNTGRQQAIYDKWLGPLQEQGLPWKQLGKVAAILSVLLLVGLGGTVIWNRMLKRQVDKRTAELHMQQQQLIQADKMTSLGILVSGVAHEINNPSGLLLLNLPVLREAWQDCQDYMEQRYEQEGDFMLGGLAYSRMREEIPAMLDEMHEGARRIKRIVNDLKDFARQESEDIREPFDLNEVVATAVRLVDNSIRNSTDHFQVRYSERIAPVLGNAQRIEQVVINLILNACQALPNRSKGVSLRTLYRADLQQVSLLVEDQGCGIEPENLNRLLDPFFTTKREHGGTGLGLSVSSGIVQAHGGSLTFESSPGQGTSVMMTLPTSGAPNQ